MLRAGANAVGMTTTLLNENGLVDEEGIARMDKIYAQFARQNERMLTPSQL